MKKINGLELIENTSAADRRAARSAAAYHGRGGWTSIYGAYKNPSAEKVRAWRAMERLAVDLDGFDLKITAANTFSFSALFRFLVDGREAIAYITKDHERFAWARA